MKFADKLKELREHDTDEVGDIRHEAFLARHSGAIENLVRAAEEVDISGGGTLGVIRALAALNGER